MDPLLRRILDYLATKDPPHAAKVETRLSSVNPATAKKAVAFFKRYQAYIERRGKTLEYGLDCYLTLIADMADTRMDFLRTGKYVNSSFADVEKHLYLNPQAFEYHMHGLVFAQFFWPDQLLRFEFFARHVGAALSRPCKYLEIGGGHALYLLEAVNQGVPGVQYSLVDISPSSIELANGITDGLPIHSQLLNIFDYAPTVKFDFISIGEVVEHVEDPLSLLVRVRELLAPGGTAFISTPANAPTIDHIYLFNSVDEIRAMLREAGFAIMHEAVEFAEGVTAEVAAKLKMPVMFAAMVQAAAKA